MPDPNFCTQPSCRSSDFPTKPTPQPATLRSVKQHQQETSIAHHPAAAGAACRVQPNHLFRRASTMRSVNGTCASHAAWSRPA
jgi:hypothetical protein